MSIFSELTSILKVTEYKIKFVDLDCIKLGKLLEPTKNIIAINSNYIHKCFDGYDQFLSKPILNKSKSKRGGLRGDHSTFNSCIEFRLNLVFPERPEDKSKTTFIRYFPKSGSIQLYHTCNNIIDTFLQYLKECGLSEFTSVELVNKTILLNNFKFSIILDSNKIIDLSHLYNRLESEKFSAPFSIKNIKFGKHSNIIILFNNKIRIHIWHSGKVNLFGTKDGVSARMIYNFLFTVFTKKKNN